MFRNFLLVLVYIGYMSVYAGQNYEYGLKMVESQGDMNQDRRHGDGYDSYKDLWYKSCPLGGYDASGTKLDNVHFTYCSGQELSFSNITFNTGEIQHCLLNDAVFTGATLNSVVFDESDATNMNCTNTIFNSCTLRNIVSDGLVLDGTVFRCSHLRGLDWSNADIKLLTIDEKTSVEGLKLPFSALANISIEGRDNLDGWGIFDYLHKKGAVIVYDKRGDSFITYQKKIASKFPLKAKEELPESIFAQDMVQVRQLFSDNLLKSELRNRKKRDTEMFVARNSSEPVLVEEESSIFSFTIPSLFLSCFGESPDFDE